MQTVEVLANPECPHCRHALDHVTRLATEAGVPVAGVDLVHHPEVAGSWEHSPIVRYGRATFAGVPTPDEFRRLLAEGRGKGI
jgi:glutaredoxin